VFQTLSIAKFVIRREADVWFQVDFGQHFAFANKIGAS
jgi:hypothetical protein